MPTESGLAYLGCDLCRARYLQFDEHHCPVLLCREVERAIHDDCRTDRDRASLLLRWVNELPPDARAYLDVRHYVDRALTYALLAAILDPKVVDPVKHVFGDS